MTPSHGDGHPGWSPRRAARRLSVSMLAVALAALALVATPLASWAAPQPILVSIALLPSSQSAPVNTTVTLIATVRSLVGVVSGTPVTFTVSGVNSRTGTVTTNSSGQAAFSYTGGSTVGVDTVIASTLGANAVATVTWTSGAATMTLSPSSTSATVGTSLTFVAHATSAGGAPVLGALVSFTVSGANSATGSDYTDASGNAHFTYTGVNAGTDTVQASASGFPTDTSTVTWTAAAANSVTISPSSLDAVAGTSQSFTATVKDVNGNPVVGALVTFTVTGANSASSSATTNSSGQAAFSYTGANAGTDAITASSLGVSGTASVTWLTGPLSITLTTTGTSLNTGTAVTVTATVKDGAGNLAAGILVRFAVTGANTTGGSVATNASGQAGFAYTGTNAGTDTVTAFADLNSSGAQDSGEPVASVTVTWTAVTPPAPPTPGAFAPAQPTTPKAGCTYFAATGHNLCAGFQAYWNQFGGLANFGFPRTEEFVENGITVQYFERARFEWHPGVWPSHYDVLLGLVGDEITAGRSGQAPFQPTGAKMGCTYFAATGHNLCNGFASFWSAFGGLETFGMPISEEFVEQNPDTGRMYTVQYFERARFEWHPGEWPARYDVMLGRLGAQVLALRYHTMY